MFFSISNQHNTDFPNHVQWGEFCIDYDNGWTLTDNVLYKGYSTYGELKDISINNITDYSSSPGTFCILYYKNDSIFIETGERQKFPIFINRDNLKASNLITTNELVVGKISITSSSITCIPIPDYKFKNLNLSDDLIIQEINSTLTNTILKFKTTLPFKIYLTGGVDTLILMSIILKNKIPYELVKSEYVEMDYFLCHNRNKLKDFWAYKDLQHWKKPTILISGANGDENLIRNPHAAYLLLREHSEDLINVCQTQWYHSSYFLKEKHLNQYNSIDQYKFNSLDDLKNWILNRNSADYQHWHLGNTILFTPFNNLYLSQLMLNLSYNKLRSQLIDAAVSKEIIKMNCPSLLKYISDEKNVNNFSKLWKVYEGIENLDE